MQKQLRTAESSLTWPPTRYGAKQAVGDAWGVRPTVFPKSHSELHGFESAVDMVGYTALLG